MFFIAGAQEKPVICLDENDGLCDDEVREVRLDNEDILWIGTNNGISAYDGNRFVCYRKSDGLAGSRVWGLAVDDQNRIYAGCYVGGLSRISNGRVTDTWYIPDTTVRNTIRKLLYDEKSRSVVVGTDYGIYLFRDSVFHRIRYDYSPKHKKSSIISLKKYKGHIYFTVHGHASGLYELQTDPDSLERSEVIPLITDVNLFGLTFSGDTAYANFYNELYACPLSTPGGVVIAKAPEGFLPWDMVTLPRSWIMTGGFRISDFVENTKFFNLREKHFVDAPWMLRSDEILVFCYDTLRKIVWAGTADGLKAVLNTPFSYYCPEEKEIIDLAEWHDTLFVLNKDGLYMLRGRKTVPLLTRSRIDAVLLRKSKDFCSRVGADPFELISAKPVNYRYFIQDNGRMFISTNKGALSIPDLKTYLPFSLGRFVSCGGGVCYIRDYRPMVYYPDLHDLPKGKEIIGKEVGGIKDVMDIRQVGEICYMPSYFNGIYAVKDHNIFHLNRNNSDIDNFIAGIDIDSQGDAWVISLDGNLFQVGFEDSLVVKKKINHYNSEIIGESYKWLLFNNGYLYLASNKGLNIVPEEELRRGEIRSLWFYNRYNGYLDISTRDPVRAGRGYLFVHNGKRLIRIGRPIKRKGLAELRIRDLIVDGERQPISSPDQKIFSPRTGNISMTYYLLKYPTDKNVSYRYRLNKGAWTATNIVSLPFLKPGRYHIVMEAKDLERDEVYRKTFTFEIPVPYLSRWWVVLGILTILFLGIFFFIKRRFELRHRREEERNRMIRESAELQVKALQLQMNPHFIFNTLNTIQSAVVSRSSDETLDFIGDLSLVIRENLESVMKDYVPLSREIAFLQKYAGVERFRLGDKVSIDFILAVEDPDSLLIPPMLIQPLIENSIKHGILPKKEGGEIEVRVEQEVDHLLITVRDNGIGRQQAGKKMPKNHKSRGVDLLKKRLEYLNLKNNTKVNRIEYEDLYEDGLPAGTLVRLYLQIVKRKKDEQDEQE